MRVRIGSGVLEGEADGGPAVFRGIPYAELPARFGAPEPVRAWDGVRSASTFGPPPPQSGAFGADGPSERGDGWLTLNVWSPDLGGALPVMVWIQGGAYLFGTSGLPEYDGSALARAGVVVVTLNYRVGIEGFAQLEGHPANRGLLDQVAALEWVRDNIAAFGGDPRRVTVFGQSAGGGCVAALLAMPRARGLFQRAIAQSVPGAFFTPELAADITRACAVELGCRPAELAEQDPWLLPAAADAVLASMDRHVDRWGLAAHAQVPVAPVVDGVVLPAMPWDAPTAGVDLLVGHTRHEQRLLTALSGRLGQITRAEADQTARLFAPDPLPYLDAFDDPDELYDVVRSDWLFRMPSLALAQAHLAAGGRTHVYELTWPAPGMGGVLGACHGLDVPLVFGNLASGQTAMLIGEPTPQAHAVSGQMQAAWVAFARDGDPDWPTFDDDSTRLFDAQPQVTAYPEGLSRSIWTTPPAVLDLI